MNDILRKTNGKGTNVGQQLEQAIYFANLSRDCAKCALEILKSKETEKYSKWIKKIK